MSDDRDMVVQGFESYCKDMRFTRPEIMELYKHLRALPIPIPIAKAIRAMWAERVKLPPALIISKMLRETGEFEEDEIKDAAEFIIAFDGMRDKLTRFDVSISKLFGLKMEDLET